MSNPLAHILVIDEDQARQSSLVTQLTALGYAVENTAISSELFLVRTLHPFDLLLLHIDVAAANHFAFLQKISHDDVLRQLPVILLGTPADMEALGQGLSQGASDTLILPSNAALLRARIEANLGARRWREQAAWYLQEFNEMEKLADDLRLKILPLGIALSVEQNFDRLLEQIVEEAMAICNADAGTLYLRTGDDHLRFVIVRTRSLNLAYGGREGQLVPYDPIPLYNAAGTPNQHNVASFAAVGADSVNIADIYHEAGFDFSGTKSFDHKNNYRSISCLTVPLKNHEVIGVLQLLNAQDASGDVVPFGAYHQLVAESLASQATIVLNNHMLTLRQEELRGFEREMEIARELQADFLPAQLPQLEKWEIAAYIQPALAASGDFYDAFTLPDGKIGLVIADVCDKGVAAAFFMALVRSLLRAFITQYHYLQAQRVLAQAASPSTRSLLTAEKSALQHAVILTNDYIGRFHSSSNMFTTLFFGALDPETGAMTYVNAGHNPPWLLSADGGSRQLAPTGPAIGLRTSFQYETRQLSLQPGDTLLLYTDGVTEARNNERQMFAPQLLPLLQNHAGPVSTLLESIHQAVRSHMNGSNQADDITMLAVRHLP